MKKAFTLAEVLITLSIIGVIAAMVIPSLVQDVQEAQHKTAWKKAFGDISQAYKIAISKNGTGFGAYTCTGWGKGDTATPKFNALKKAFNVIKECEGNSYGNCWPPNGITPVLGPGCACQHTSYRSFVAANGWYFMLCSDCTLVSVDINGSKGPNQWGKDAFTFTMHDRNISPSGCEPTNNSINYLRQ